MPNAEWQNPIHLTHASRREEVVRLSLCFACVIEAFEANTTHTLEVNWYSAGGNYLVRFEVNWDGVNIKENPQALASLTVARNWLPKGSRAAYLYTAYTGWLKTDNPYNTIFNDIVHIFDYYRSPDAP